MAQNQTYVFLVFCKQMAAPVFTEYLSCPGPLLNLIPVYLFRDTTHFVNHANSKACMWIDMYKVLPTGFQFLSSVSFSVSLLILQGVLA